LEELTKNIIKIVLISLLISLVGFLLYIAFKSTNVVIAIYGLVLVFVGIIVFSYLPEYIIYRKLSEKE